jgi:hypothetical protein
MHNTRKLLLQLSMIVFISIVVLVVTYTWLLPTIFSNYTTYLPLVLVVCAAAMIGTYYARQSTASWNSALSRWGLSIGMGTLTAVLVVLCSFFIIFNLRGT